MNQTIQFQNPAKSVAVDSMTLYENASETGTPDLNLSPANFIKIARGAGDKSPVLNVFGDTSSGPGGKAIGDFDRRLRPEQQDDRRDLVRGHIGVGSAGTLDVGATQTVIAVSLVQSGGAGGDVGFAGTLNWFNLTSLTEPRIDDGVTVNAGSGGGQGGAVAVHSDDNMIIVAVTGGAVKSNHIGVGFTVAVNNVNRTTLAVIGVLDPSLAIPTPYPGPHTALAGSFNVTP